MRYAICNETFGDWEHRRTCEFIRSLGYEGLEIAPFTLAPLITDVSAARRRELRAEAEGTGVAIIGLHWLLAKTTGFQLTSPDASIRAKTAAYLGELAKCCRDLGGDKLVFGSPAQRHVPPGATYEQAFAWAIDTFQQALPVLADQGVYLCLEPLAPDDTLFLTTCAEAVRMIEAINHPHFVLHQDVKAMCSEAVPIPDLIRQYARYTRHFHANDANRRGPGTGSTDFRLIFAALKEVGYTGYVSVEVFDYSPDPQTIARESIEYMRRAAA